MNSDSHPIADVLLPLALEGPYSYRIPAGMALEEAKMGALLSFAAAPLAILFGRVLGLKGATRSQEPGARS